MKKPKIALVLSGGAAMGYAHLGVLEVLLDNDIIPDIIVGTSMGAVIGGAYTAGLTIEEMYNYIYEMNMFKFVDINFNFSGVFSGSKIDKLFKKVYKDITNKQCICKFATVAADVDTGQEVVLKSGKIADMVRASMNVPGILVPVNIDGRKLIDGGVVNNYPDDVAKNLGADIIIGVDVLKQSYTSKENKNFMDNLFSSLQILQNELYKYKPTFTDVLITPSLKEMSQSDFKKEKIDYAILKGKKEAEKAIDKIKEKILLWERNN